MYNAMVLSDEDLHSIVKKSNDNTVPQLGPDGYRSRIRERDDTKMMIGESYMDLATTGYGKEHLDLTRTLLRRIRRSVTRSNGTILNHLPNRNFPRGGTTIVDTF